MRRRRDVAGLGMMATINLDEWRKDAEVMLHRNQWPGGNVDAVDLARRLIAVCKAMEVAMEVTFRERSYLSVGRPIVRFDGANDQC